MNGFLSWWDGVELWLAGLGFIAQTVLVLPVVLLVAFGIAFVMDALLARGITLLRRIRHADQTDRR